MRRRRALSSVRSAAALGPATRMLAIVLGLGLGGVAFGARAQAASDTSVGPHATTNVDPAPRADIEAARLQRDDGTEVGSGVVDPRKRRWPRTHRFRLGLQLDYVRLSAAVDDDGPDQGKVQRFHYLPLQLDFAYQVQLLKYFMLRPSVAFGGNPANTAEAMPAVVHPQIFAGYQGKAVGVALGYGYLHPFPAVANVISDTRGGLGQPIITKNHALRAELSYTTRVDRGALSFALRIGGIKSHIQHYDLDERSWRFMVGFNLGWYFGDGHRSEQRERERREQRRARRR